MIAEGDQDADLTQARTSVFPVAGGLLSLTTMSRTAKLGAHGYSDVYALIQDLQTEPHRDLIAVPSLRRNRQSDGYEVVAGDLYPVRHDATGTVLITGKTFSFEDGTRENILREQVAYCVFRPTDRSFGPLRMMEMPAHDHSGRPIIAPNAGCHQQVVSDDGTVYLPVRYQQSRSQRVYTSVVARCRFDGTTLSYVEHGSEHTIPTGRGLYEPSVTTFDGRWFLTLRSDDGAWVAAGTDGITFGEHVPWKFDDGTDLGSHHTQQHWAVIGGRLYLVYTRRGADNDHIMRHRAPLFIAQADPERLVVLRQTEQIVVPQNHATLGNFGVCSVSPDESWITVAEGRISYGARKGEVNKVILAKVRSAP